MTVELRDPMADLLCRCGKLARGVVKRDGWVPEHWCRACCDEHCEMRRVIAKLRGRRAGR